MNKNVAKIREKIINSIIKEKRKNCINIKLTNIKRTGIDLGYITFEALCTDINTGCTWVDKLKIYNKLPKNGSFILWLKNTIDSDYAKNHNYTVKPTALEVLRMRKDMNE